MKNNLFGVIIKVNDIDLCRDFYRMEGRMHEGEIFYRCQVPEKKFYIFCDNSPEVPVENILQ